MLSKAEIQYLKGQKQVSKSFEYKLKHSILKKVDSFFKNELPLLRENHVLELLSIKSLGKAKVAGSIPAQGFLCNPKESRFELLSEQVNDEVILPNSERNNVNDHLDWEGYKQDLEKNFNQHTPKALFPK